MSAISQISLPTSSIGRLIGKCGATIKELEALTNCRVQIPRRDSPEAAQASAEGVTAVSVYCKAAANSEVGKTLEERCLRAAHLLCVEGLTLADAFVQVDAEQQAQELLDQERRQKHEIDMAVQRIRMNWTEFDPEDVKAALSESCNDEDAAIDLILNGYRAPCTAQQAPASIAKYNSPQQNMKPETKPKPKEEFPALAPQQKSQQSGFILGRASLTAWSVPAAKSKTQAVEQFPCLPEPRPCPSSKRNVQKPCVGSARRNLCRTHLCR